MLKKCITKLQETKVMLYSTWEEISFELKVNKILIINFNPNILILKVCVNINFSVNYLDSK